MQPMTPINLDRIIGLAQWYVPEIILSIAAIVIILLSLIDAIKHWSFYAAVFGIILHLFFITDYTFPLIMAVAALITILISGRRQRIEYYFFILSLLIGAEVLAKVGNFITIILS